MKQINVGKMNKKIYICNPTTATDDMGQDILCYSRGRKIWATVKSVRGGEYYEAMKLHPEISYIIYVRYREDIHEDTIMEYKGKKLEVKYVSDMEEEHKMLEIQCTEYKKKDDDNGWIGI